MHHSISYSNLTPMEKQLRALADCSAWLGDRADFVSGVMVEYSPTSTTRQLINGLSFAGIQGYPARVFILWSLRAPKGIQLGD